MTRPICDRGVIVATGEECPFCKRERAEEQAERSRWLARQLAAQRRRK